MKIPYVKPSITELETRYAHDAAENGWGSNCYEYINRFEKGFGEIVGADYVIATSSCTGALTLGYSALGLLPGDEVIVADANWIASIAPLLHAGVKVIPVDIDQETWCIDPDEVSKFISSKTKAILATHLYGNMCDMDRLSKIAQSFNLKVIEDSAEALGSYFGKSHAGVIGDFGAFSFHGSKTLTTGEGGAFVTNDRDLYDKVLTLSNHGSSKL
jgi:perosamine synthetase